MGDTTMRFGSVTPPRSIGVKSVLTEAFPDGSELRNRDADHAVAADDACETRLVPAFGPGRAHWQHHVAHVGGRVVDSNDHVSGKLQAEFGLKLPGDMVVRVHDSTADMRYMVLPMRPAGTEGWDEARLASIVSRDCMIGVAVPQL